MILTGADGNDYQTVVVRLYTTTSSTSDMATISNATAGGGAGVESVQLYTLQILDDDDLPIVNFTDGEGYTTDGDDKTDIAESGSSVDLYFELSRPQSVRSRFHLRSLIMGRSEMVLKVCFW